ncbi:hypothetical protein Hanom_Chr06g00530351 [Helianthus anomalus]
MSVLPGFVRFCIRLFYQKGTSSSSESIRRDVFSRYNVAKLEQLIRPGSFVDAYISLDSYNYQQNARIRLVADC